MAVAVIKRFLYAIICLTPIVSFAMVLDDDRVDVLYQSYNGGGTDVVAPAILIRKKITENSAVSAEYLVDMVSGASIDVEVGASKYTEERTEYGAGVEYLKEKNIVKANYTASTENDYDAKTYSLNVAHDFFGDLTSVNMGLALGNDIIGNSQSPTFQETAKHAIFDLGISQILSKNFITILAFNKSIDEGYLQNPYRFTRYRDNTAKGWTFDKEEYPDTLSSDAWSISGRYFLAPRKVIHFSYRSFQNTWGINANDYAIGYSFAYLKPWTFDVKWRNYEQSSADFYRDLFDYANQTNFRARDKELSRFDNQMLSFVVTYEFTPKNISFVKKSSVNFLYDYVQFNYHNFRDLRVTGVAAGKEPLYEFSANVMRLMLSIWY